MKETAARFSLEEFALILSVLGYPETSKGLLLGQLGEISADEERGRLEAATHSLLAKDLFASRGEELQLKSEIAQMMATIVVNDYALRCTEKHSPALEQNLTIYVKGEQIVQQQVSSGVLYAFETLSSRNAARESCRRFFDLTLPIETDDVSFTIADEQLENARVAANESVEEGKSLLVDVGVDQDAAQMLSEDLSLQIRRGSILRIRTSTEEGTVSDEGFLILVGSCGRCWLMDIHREGNETLLTGKLASKEMFDEAVVGLLSSVGE